MRLHPSVAAMLNTNKCKKQVNKLKKASRDDRAKKYTNKSSRDNSRQCASLHIFHRNPVT